MVLHETGITMNPTLYKKIEELQRASRELLHLGEADGMVYADDLSRLNREVCCQSRALLKAKGETPEEEAAICAALLMGYTVTMYGNPVEQQKQQILNRALYVLDDLPVSLLKCQLLTYCYGVAGDEELLKEACEIIDSWGERELLEEEKEVVEGMKCMMLV